MRAGLRLLNMRYECFSPQLAHDEHNARDLDILNQYANELNQETLDALTYQVPL